MIAVGLEAEVEVVIAAGLVVEVAVEVSYFRIAMFSSMPMKTPCVFGSETSMAQCGGHG